MKAVLLHPDDLPESVMDSVPRPDILVDLGWAGRSAYGSWRRRFDCEVLSIYDHVEGVGDWGEVGRWIASGRGKVVDRHGIDWWDILSPLYSRSLLDLLLAKRLAARLSGAELLASRPSRWSGMLEPLAGKAIPALMSPKGGRLRRLLSLGAELSPRRMLEIAVDKCDPVYRFRRRLARRPVEGGVAPPILLPSAYVNVSRTAVEYARMLPERRFLLASTRQGGALRGLPMNISAVPLAAYAAAPSSFEGERLELAHAWERFKAETLVASRELALASRLGFFDAFGPALSRGLSVREAWLELFRREELSAVLCGDDNNPHLLMPVILARQKNLPVVVYNHGALDYSLLTREFRGSVYLAKGEIERDYLLRVCGLGAESIRIGAAPSSSPRSYGSGGGDIVYFSEPYEILYGGRCGEIYRSVLTQLCSLARGHKKRIIIKLHPFENLRARERLLAAILEPGDRALVSLREAPLSEGELSDIWFSLSVESSVVVEQAVRGKACFICGWLDVGLSGYAEQYARFGAGCVLKNPEEIARIPEMLKSPFSAKKLYEPVSPAGLARLLGG